MRRQPTPPSAAARLLPLAAGATFLLVAATVVLTRHRADRDRRSRPTAGTPPRPTALSGAADPLVLTSQPILTEPPRRTTKLAPVGIAAALLLGSLGVAFVGIGLGSQRSAAETPLSSPPSEAPPGREIEGWSTYTPPPPVRPEAVQPTRAPAPKPAPLVLARSLPVSLQIPAIDVRSAVRHLGQADDGTLETPRPGPYYNDAAWYRHSPTPGQLGPSILLGHIDSAAEGPSVFFRLGELGAGDRVAVTRADGSVAVFRVDRVRRYAKDSFPTDLVYGDIDHAGLRLVTCGGAFDNASGHYLDNVVVFASLVVP